MLLRLEKAWLRAADEDPSDARALSRTAMPTRSIAGSTNATSVSGWWKPATEAQQAALEALAYGRAIPADLTRGEASLLIEEWGGPVSLNTERIGVRQRAPMQLGGNCTKAMVLTAAGRVLVSVSKRSPASPGAACARYHERAGAEVLHDDDIAEWRGDRYSVIVSPEPLSLELAELAERIIEDLAGRHGDDFKGAAWIHHERDRGGHDHLHLAVSAADGRVIVTQRQMERSVRDAVKAIERALSREASR
jgi:hypothetical protein